ncbi:MAG: nitrogen fixation protein NifZ [Campylobacterales bacterium]
MKSDTRGVNEAPLYEVNTFVEALQDIKNDGTFPYGKVGDVLIPKGSKGYVRKTGDFLQTIRVYEVDFIEVGLVVGCRDFEIKPI